MKFHFLAQCGNETHSLEVDIKYAPGNRTQYARKLAVGQLLADMEIEAATIDATDGNAIFVKTDKGTWLIAEGTSVAPQRGKL